MAEHARQEDTAQGQTTNPGEGVEGVDAISTDPEGVPAGIPTETSIAPVGSAIENAVEAGRRALAKTKEAPETPANWEECYKKNNPESGARVIDFEKARAFLYKKMRNKKDPWQPTPELALTITEKPGEEEPFSLGVFTPTPSGDPSEREKHEKNLILLTRYSLQSAGAPKDMLTEKNLRRFISEYYRKLGMVRQKHPEVRVNEDIQKTTTEVLKAFAQIKNVITKKHESSRLLGDYGIACRLFEDIPKLAEQAGTLDAFSGVESTLDIPEYFFGSEDEEPHKYQERFIGIMLLLDQIGFINLSEYEKVSLDIATIPEGAHSAELQELAQLKQIRIAEKTIRMLNIIMWAGRKAINFLKTGEKMYSNMQKEHLIPRGIAQLDTADYLEDLKNKSPLELIEYAVDNNNPTDWRHQAIMLAFIGLQFTSIRLSPHYKNADKVERKMRETFLEKINWEKDETNPRKLRTAFHTYYSNGKGDYAIEADEEYDKERKLECRIWKGPSGKEYHVRIIDEENVQKSKESILFKALLKNSKGDPKELFDLVRFTFVFANVNNFHDPTVRKDLYYLLYEIGTQYGMHPKLAEKAASIDWEEDDADTIYKKLTKDRSAMGSGYFTVEDKTQKKKDKISSSAFEDIKLVGRDPRHATGQEVQFHTLESYLLASSAHEDTGHKLYDDRKARKLLKQMNPSHLYPGTYLRLEALDIMEAEHILRRKARKKDAKMQETYRRGQEQDIHPTETWQKVLALKKEQSLIIAQADKIKAQGDVVLKLIQEVEGNGEALEGLEEHLNSTCQRLQEMRQAA